MQAVQPKFAATKTEVQTIILNWVQATEDFHHYYCQVNEAINALNPDRHSRSGKTKSLGNSRTDLQALTKLPHGLVGSHRTPGCFRTLIEKYTTR